MAGDHNQSPIVPSEPLSFMSGGRRKSARNGSSSSTSRSAQHKQQKRSSSEFDSAAAAAVAPQDDQADNDALSLSDRDGAYPASGHDEMDDDRDQFRRRQLSGSRSRSPGRSLSPGRNASQDRLSAASRSPGRRDEHSYDSRNGRRGEYDEDGSIHEDEDGAAADEGTPSSERSREPGSGERHGDRRGGGSSRYTSDGSGLPRKHQGQPQPEPCNVLGVFNMSLYTLDKDIFKMFEPFAIPTSINIIRDPVTGRSRRYAFVTFASVEDATRARNGTQQATLHERIMRVDYSWTLNAAPANRSQAPQHAGPRPRYPQAQGPPYYGGYGGRGPYRSDWGPPPPRGYGPPPPRGGDRFGRHQSDFDTRRYHDHGRREGYDPYGPPQSGRRYDADPMRMQPFGSRPTGGPSRSRSRSPNRSTPHADGRLHGREGYSDNRHRSHHDAPAHSSYDNRHRNEGYRGDREYRDSRGSSGRNGSGRPHSPAYDPAMQRDRTSGSGSGRHHSSGSYQPQSGPEEEMSTSTRY